MLQNYSTSPVHFLKHVNHLPKNYVMQ